MHQPEILAPAGSYDAFLAAVHNGCNAVYLGGEKFGARAYASNFDHAALRRVVDYCKKFDIKLYYTINTLIKDTEVSELLEEVNTLRTIGVHTFIFQDIGMIDLLNRTFDDIEIHGSTQMNCHSAYGMDFLQAMGLTRVVLSRELSIDEIKTIKGRSNLEIETFVHGALCYSYSGQCLMSSFLGGRSGNRGRCAQPCRLKYKTIIDDIDVSQGHILSPKDIETLTILPELIDAGIDSFKIEGRMKSKEYVGLMTRLYRFYTDQYMTEGHIKVKQQDINDMTQIFNRGDFSNGYYQLHNGPSMITIDQPKNQGVVVGKVKESKGIQVTISFFEPIKKGDCIELLLHDGSYHSLIVDSDMKGTKRILTRAKSLIQEGVEVRRIKSVKLNERINERSSNISQKYIHMYVLLQIDAPMTLIISDDSRSITVTGELVQEAKKQGLTQERVEKQFLKVGDYPVLIEDITLEMEDQVFAPIGQLNQLRRKGMEEWFCIKDEPIELVSLPLLESYKNQYNPNRFITLLLKNSDQLDVVLKYSVDRVYLEWFDFEREAMNGIIERCHEKGVQVYIAIPKIVRHENDAMLSLMMDNLVDSIDGFLIRSFDSYMFVRSRCSFGHIQWDYGMSIMNRFTSAYLLGLEAGSGFCPSLEMNKHDMKTMNLHEAEVLVYGYAKVMTTAQCVRKNTSGCVKEPGKILHLEDRKGVKVPVETVCQLCYNNIYNGVPHYLIDKMDELSNKGVGQFRLDLLNESPSEIRKLLDATFDDGLTKPKPIVEPFTRGHYNKGVE